MKSRTFLKQNKATILYIITTVVVNVLYSILPFYTIFGRQESPADALVGAIYVVRDFAQREIGHKVVWAMLTGTVLSFLLASNTVALASASAFLVGETIDWLIFTFTKKPLSQRLLWSSMISAPIDTFVFLKVLGNLNSMEFISLSLAKFTGVLLLWYFWRMKHRKTQEIQNEAIMPT